MPRGIADERDSADRTVTPTGNKTKMNGFVEISTLLIHSAPKQKSNEWMHLSPYYTRMLGEWLRYAKSTSQFHWRFLLVRDVRGFQVNPLCRHDITRSDRQIGNQIAYLALSPNDYSPIDSLCQCIDEINSWMCQNFIQLNKEKTEVIAFENKDEVLKVNAYLDSRGQTTKNQVRNLGVILETDLSFSSHVKAVTKSAYYHLKNIARIRCFVSSQDLEKLVHAFITSRVDYCNSLLTGLPKKTIRQLQLIQNAAARILTRTRKSEHITPVLRSLHWLPVTFRIDFKVLLLIYKSLNGLGPKYMADMFTEYKPNRALRSLGSSQLEIPRVHTKQGKSAFSYYAARSWNQLPEEIKCAKTLATFKSSLKTHLFSCAFVE